MRIMKSIPWVVLATVLSVTTALWHGPATKSPASKPPPTSAERAAAAGLNPTSLIVDFRDDISSQALEANGYTEIPISDFSARDRLYRIDFDSAEAAAAALAKLSNDPDVESADYDSVATIPPDENFVLGDSSMEAECQAAGGDRPSAFPNDACFRYQWHLRQIGMPDAWKLGNGKGVVVAVIDTGVTQVGDLRETKFVPGYNFVSNDDDARDDHGHGTHVAGTIAESTNNKIGVAGVAYGAAIMPIKVLSARGSGSMAGIAQGIRWAADHGANVINMSLGGRFAMGAIGSAVKYAHGKGVVIVAAAGNDGSGRVSYPAKYPGVIAVAATQFSEATTFYSNWGPEIDVAAPGGNTRVDENGDGKPDGVLQHTIIPNDTSKTDYLWFMGTSMASPHVAGVAALVMGAGIRKPDAVEEILLDTARKPKGSAVETGRIDDHYGAGVVDAHAALKKVRGGRGAGELSIAGALALLGVSLLRRRGRGVERLGLGFLGALVVGSSGIFVLPFLLPGGHPVLSAIAAPLSSGFTLAVASALGPAAYGNPLLWSAIAPLAFTVLFYGFPRLRPALAGFGFGIAGALLFSAVSGAVDVRYVPDFLDRVWLCAHAGVAALFAGAVIRKA